MDRRAELLKIVGDNDIIIPMIEDVVQLEQDLAYLRSLPQIIVHPKDTTRQKATPAAKLYKEMLQQYTNIIKILIRVSGADDMDEESPLRRWVNERMDTR